MADLRALGYSDESMAQLANDEVDGLSGESIIQRRRRGHSGSRTTVLKSSLSKGAEQDLQEVLNGRTAW